MGNRQELLSQSLLVFHNVELKRVTVGGATRFLDFLAVATETLAYERGTLYHPLKLCYFHCSEGISSRYFTKNIWL
jgi:hypothetical protein